MSIQYNAIGDSYNKTLPGDRVELHTMAQILGRLDGQKCLDLATGHGRGARLLLEQGAASVVAVDISETMVKSAKEAYRDEDRIEFRVGDCGQVDTIEGGPFDAAISMWLLNYAANHAELREMLRNVHLNLKPGGRMVAMTLNVCINADASIDPKYGVQILSVSPVEDGGHKCFVQVLANPKKPWHFSCYHFDRETYEKAATEAGLVDLQWRAYVIPDDDEMPEGFWELYKMRPVFSVLTARKTA